VLHLRHRRPVMGGALAAAGLCLLIGAAIEAAHRVNERRQERRLYTPLIHVRTIEREDR
jgi:hypothetical protein